MSIMHRIVVSILELETNGRFPSVENVIVLFMILAMNCRGGI
jgi:hypothetical protein